jgi:hypothetical protein
LVDVANDIDRDDEDVDDEVGFFSSRMKRG